MILREGDQRLSVNLKRSGAIYVPPAGELRVRTRAGRVYVLWGGRAFEMSTPIAAKAGFALAKKGHEAMLAGERVAFTINGVELELLPESAIQLGGVMLKKTDRADDWQRQVGARRLSLN